MAINNSSDGGWPTADSGGALSDVMGSISGAGTLGVGSAGTNGLQQSIDALTRAVGGLTSEMASGNFSGGSAGTGKQIQQQGGGAGLFPAMQNFFGGGNSGPASGIGGGGPGGAGNVTPPNTFGSIAAAKQGLGAGGLTAAFMGYGQGQMPGQLGINTYATMTSTAMGGSVSFNQLYSQSFGFKGRNLNTNAAGVLDAAAGTQTLQQVGANPIIGNSAIGRAAWGSANAFGIGNPAMSYAQSASAAANLYSQQVSFNLLRQGIPTPRNQNGTAKSMAAFSRGIFSSLFNNSRGNVSNQEVFAGLAPGSRANMSLSAAGINVSSLEPTLQEYATLFRHNYSTAGAQKLINQASIGSRSQTNAARQRLNSLGISTATSDISSLKSNQAQLTGRDADVAGGFSAGLKDATGMLQQFNAGLSSLLTTLHANGLVGGAGGALGTIAGTNHGNSLLGMGSSAAMMGAATKFILKGGGGGLLGGGSAGLLGGAGGGITGLGIDGAAAGAAGTVGGLGILAALAGYGALKVPENKVQASMGRMGGLTGSSAATQAYNAASVGGGATSSSNSSQQAGSSGGKSMSGNVAGAANVAVGAARSQLGVPYHYGDELPGVGFDCSGLTQWAYKQAGVNIPRRSQDQWAALSRKSVPMKDVQAGDLVFAAGSDGTPNSPGHVGMMINNRQLIQAPHTGADVDIIGLTDYFTHAARPSGHGGLGVTGGGGGSPGLGGTGSSSTTPGLVGNMGMSIGGSYGSSEEVDNVAGALGGIGGGGIGFGAAGGGAGTTGAGGGGAGGSGNGKGTAGLRGNRKIMNQIAARYGWGTGSQWKSLNSLEMGEAGYNNLAQNPISTAYGMGQFLDTTWATVGGHKTSDPTLQAEYMMKYIKQRYRNPETAYSDWSSRNPHWYSQGGSIKDSISVVGERGPELMIGGAGGTVMNNSQTAAILKAAQAQPAQSPWQALSELQTIGNTNASAQQQNQACINLNFNKDSIVVRVDHAGSDVRSTGKQIAQQIVNSMADERVMEAIRTGRKNG